MAIESIVEHNCDHHCCRTMATGPPLVVTYSRWWHSHIQISIFSGCHAYCITPGTHFTSFICHVLLSSMTAPVPACGSWSIKSTWASIRTVQQGAKGSSSILRRTGKFSPSRSDHPASTSRQVAGVFKQSCHSHVFCDAQHKSS